MSAPTPADYIVAGFALVPIPYGSKAPKDNGWQLEKNAVRTIEQAERLNGGNIGIAHRWCGTCAVDADDYAKALDWLAARGIYLDALLAAEDAVQISSGRENRCKLLFRTPDGVVWLPTLQIDAGGLEFRCATRDGSSTVVDVLPPSLHPTTGQPYVWAGLGDWRDPPELPAALLALWREQASSGARVAPGGSEGGPVPEGGRNAFLTSLAGTMRRRGMSEAGIYAALKAENAERCVPLLPQADVARIATSVSRYATGANVAGGDSETSDGDAAEGDEYTCVPATRSYPDIPPRGSLIARLDQRTTAKLTPKRVVEDYLFADVALLIAPGKTGKTTLALWEAVHIVLGRPLYGLEVVTRGVVAFITAEDGSDLLFARLCAVMDDMGLSAQDRDTVWAGVEIWDVAGVLCRLAELNRAGNVVLTGLADAIVEHFKDRPPVVLNLDPVISFGAGERLVNDNEQALILAGRRIVRGLGGCVRLICHTGRRTPIGRYRPVRLSRRIGAARRRPHGDGPALLGSNRRG